MATREAPPPGLLEGFSAPLWERLRLDRLRPLSIVRGQHRGHDWMAIDLEHGSTGLFSTGAPSTDTTTVFVVVTLIGVVQVNTHTSSAASTGVHEALASMMSGWFCTTTSRPSITG